MEDGLPGLGDTQLMGAHGDRFLSPNWGCGTSSKWPF